MLSLKKFKKIPLWLIILLIIILVFTLYTLFSCVKEGFTSFNVDADMASGPYTLPNVDASGVKLYDNNYFISSTAQIVKLVPKTTAENTGDFDIAKVKLYNRNGSSAGSVGGANGLPDPTGTNVLEATGDITPLYRSYSISPEDVNSASKNQLFYIPWGYHTYIHIIELSPSATDGTIENNIGFYSSAAGSLGASTDLTSKILINPSATNNKLTDVTNVPGQPANINDANFDGNQTTTLRFSSTQTETVYQISNNVFFHLTTADLYVKKADNGNNDDYISYSRDGVATTGFNKSSVSSPNNTLFTKSWITDDPLGGNLVAYICFTNGRTLVLVLHKGSDDNYVILNAVRIAKNGSIVTNELMDDTVPDTVEDDAEDDAEDDDDEEENQEDEDESQNNNNNNNDHTHPWGDLDLSGNVNDFYKWYWYWNSSGSLPVHFSEDYLLKTQVVPPMCPSCPATTTCTNCGGNGGGGTRNENNESVVKDDNGENTQLKDSYEKTLDTASDLLKSGGSGASSLARDTVSGTKDVLSDVATGSKDFVKDTGSGAASLLRDAAGGATNLARDTVSGATNLAKDTVTGSVDLVRELGDYTDRRSRENRGGSSSYTYQPASGGYGSTYSNQPRPVIDPRAPTSAMDPYTYNGKLKQRPSSEFLPRTADFSSFAK